MNVGDRSNVAVEPAREEHLAEIAALAGIVWRAHYPGIISPRQIEHMLARMYDISVLSQEMAAGIRFERALIDGVMRGFSSFGPASNPSEMKLHKLYVHPEWQRHGLGKRLLQSLEANARTNGARSLILNVNKRNERAIAAYRKHDFTIRESVVVDIGDGFVMDDYIMAKTL